MVNQGAGLGLEEPPTEGSHPAPTLDQASMAGTHEEVVEVEDDEMGVTPQDTDDMVVPTHADVAAMDETDLLYTHHQGTSLPSQLRSQRMRDPLGQVLQPVATLDRIRSQRKLEVLWGTRGP